MGFTPAQVDRMTLWEFMACLDGYVASQGGEATRPAADIDDDRLRALGIEGF